MTWILEQVELTALRKSLKNKNLIYLFKLNCETHGLLTGWGITLDVGYVIDLYWATDVYLVCVCGGINNLKKYIIFFLGASTL